jgi:hypothetical protein
MLLFDVAERDLCTNPKCESCAAVRKMVATLKQLRDKKPEDSASPSKGEQPAPAKAPGDHVPKVFASQKMLTDESKALRARANALDSLATALPGLTPDAIDAVHLLAEWSSQ